MNDNPYIGYADREYHKWFIENPIETWQTIHDGDAMWLRCAIDEEVLTNCYEGNKITTVSLTLQLTSP